MRKIASLWCFLMLSVSWLMAGNGTTAQEAIDFDWAAGNSHPGGNATLWYKIDLSQIQDDDVLLYLNNLSDSQTAQVTAQPFVKFGSFSSLNEPTTKEILPNRNYAMNLPNSTIRSLNVTAVYVSLTSSEPIKIAAEPVEPGEKDLECLNAPAFDYAGTLCPAGTHWFVVNVADVKSNRRQTVSLTVTNRGNGEAQIEAGVSFDCPSSGLATYSRTLQAGEELTKEVSRALLDLVSEDEVYVKVTTTQPLYIVGQTVTATTEEAQSIASSTPFYLDTEYSLNNEELWYRIKVADLQEGKQLPELTLRNNSTTPARIRADVALRNPYTSTLQRSITLGAGEVLVKEMPRNFIQQIPQNQPYIWVRVRTNNDITFSARLRNRTEGNACKSARVFSWTTGATQNKDTYTWYAVPIEGAKLAGNKDILLHVENLENRSSEVVANVAFACPCEGTTDLNRTLAPLATATRRIERTLFTNLTTDTLFVGLTSTTNIHLSAELVEAVPNPNDCVLDQAVPFDMNLGADQAGATKVWYQIELLSLLEHPDTVPVVTITNKTNNRATVEGELAFACPSENAAFKTIHLNGLESVSKEITRDMLESVNLDSVEYLYIGVSTDQDIRIQATLQKQNEGKSCVNAINFDWVNGNDQAAATTVWYKVGLTELKNTPALGAIVGIQNTDGTAGRVSGNFYFNCGEEPFKQYSTSLGASKNGEATIEHATVLSLKPDTIYIELTTDQAVHLYANTFTGTAIQPLDACQNAIDMVYNQDIDQAAGDQWYAVDMDYIQKFTSGDAKLTVTNGFGENTMRAQVAYECPVTQVMQDRELVLESNQVYTATASRTLLDNIAPAKVYVLVSTERDMTFRIDLLDRRGETCSSPILFDWDNGNTHPADQTLWYNVVLDTLKNNPSKDLQLNVQNLVPNAISAAAEIYFDCNEEPVASFNYNFEADELKYKVIDRNFMEQAGWPLLLIKLTTTAGDAHLSAELVDAVPARRDTATIDTIVCRGSQFLTISQTPYLIDKDTLLTDSIRFTYNDGPLTLQGDSILLYNVRVLYTPPMLYPTEVLTALDVQAGRAVEVSAATLALQNAYDAYTSQDSLFAKVDSIAWQQEMIPGSGLYIPLQSDLLDTKANSLTLRYIIYTECESSAKSNGLQIVPEAPMRDTLTLDTALCAGTEFRSRLQNLVLHADTTFIDTIFNLVHSATQLKDSVYVYNLKVLQPLSLPTCTVLPTAICGQPVQTEAATEALRAALESQMSEKSATVDSLYWEIKNNNTFEALTDNAITAEMQSIELRFVVLTACNDKLESDPITVAVEMPTADNTEAYNNLPAVSKYEHWLVMLNLNAIQALGWNISEDQVSWYRIVGAQDSEGGESDDEFLGNGYYYTLDRPIEGNVYAVIEIPTSENNPCGATLRTVVLTQPAAVMPIELVPSMVQAGEKVEVRHLDAQTDYRFTLYDLAGNAIRTDNISGQTVYTFTADQNAGYYMVQVVSDKQTQTRKYIVK